MHFWPDTNIPYENRYCGTKKNEKKMNTKKKQRQLKRERSRAFSSRLFTGAHHNVYIFSVSRCAFVKIRVDSWATRFQWSARAFRYIYIYMVALVIRVCILINKTILHIEIATRARAQLKPILFVVMLSSSEFFYVELI